MDDAVTILAIFLGISWVFTAPILVLVGLPMTGWVVTRWFAYKERELDLRRIETVTRLRATRLLPAWVDDKDPSSLLAWAQADRELEAIAARA